MPNLIDASFFVGEINIPNTHKTEIAENLNLFISKYEKQLLQQLFGYDLWSLYNTDATSQRFQDLINGIDYWRGLVYQVTDTVNGSLIAYYVYTFWLKSQHVWTSGIGTVRAKGDATEVMPVSLKLMNAWNEFSHQVGSFVAYMEDNRDVYPEWNPFALFEFRVINDFDI